MKVGEKRLTDLFTGESTKNKVNGKEMRCENGDGFSILYYDGRRLKLSTEDFDWGSPRVMRTVCDRVNSYFGIE